MISCSITRIVALSSTLAPIVRETFKDIAARFPETKSGQAAASALREFEASDKPEIREESMISGDLELFRPAGSAPAVEPFAGNRHLDADRHKRKHNWRLYIACRTIRGLQRGSLERERSRLSTPGKTDSRNLFIPGPKRLWNARTSSRT